jgi:glycosyltransferase involved in cell wall biosynthesis
VIPTRNRWPLLSRALDSVLDQEDVALEVVVIDEGSTDETPARLAAVTDERVRALRNDAPTGVANARNRGISAARGVWVAFLDDDDFWAPTKLRSQLDGCAAVEADFSYTGLVTTDASLELRRVSAAVPAQELERALLGMNVIGAPSSVMAKRSLLERIGGFDPGFSVLADWDLYIRLAVAGRGAACDAPLTAYLTHPTNMHLDAPAAMEEFGRLRSKHASLARSRGVKLGDDRWWGWIAGSLRRSGHRFKGAGLFLWLGLRFGRPHLIGRAAGMLAGDRLSDRARSLRTGPGPATGGSAAAASWIDAFEEPRSKAA